MRGEPGGEIGPLEFAIRWFGLDRHGGWRQQYPRLSASSDQDFLAVVGKFGILVKLLHRLLLANGFHPRQRCRTASGASSEVNGPTRLLSFNQRSKPWPSPRG